MLDNSVSLSPFDWSAASTGQEGGNKARKVRETASQFESLLIAQMLSSMRQAGGDGWLGCGEDQAGATMTEMAEQCVAQALAASGGLGLAPLVEKGLTQASEQTGEPAQKAVSHRR
jgi:Rod binding domain-containing protein